MAATINPATRSNAGAVFDPRTLAGLSKEEVAARLGRDGFNDLPAAKPRTPLVIARELVSEPVFLVLIACGSIYIFLGDMHEAGMLLGFVLLIACITLYQEHKTERTLEALRDLASPRALVIRDGKQVRIPGREVVRGDIAMLSEGARVPADGTLLYACNLSVDESLLTGESLPVSKSAATDRCVEVGPPGSDNANAVFSGSLVVQGTGFAQVFATGAHTQIGSIGKALQTIVPEQTLLQRETARWVRILAMFGLATCAFVVVLYVMTRGNWLDGILAGLTLAMAILPNELPVVLTIFLALGAWRISRRRVLTRRVPAIEALGSASVLCVDKTGTVTMNRMAVAQLYAGRILRTSEVVDPSLLPDDFHEVLEFGMLASQKDPFDPMERAINEYGNSCLSDTEHLHADWELVQQYPLSPSVLALSQVWRSRRRPEYVVAAKGAPEAITDLCHLPADQTLQLMARVSEMAAHGLRVLGVARAVFADPDLPPQQHDFEFEFVGLIGLHDPVRPGVAEAVQQCYSAGIRVLMITGDHPATAMNVAAEIGLHGAEQCITGPELERMTDFELQERVRYTTVFARMVPEQKLKLVRALKANGEIVAMTGDGVNDAPALRAANIGIAMGRRGTDVAREAAGLVLLDDNFTSIVHAIRLGRTIFDNLKRAIAYTLATHLPIVGLTVIPVLMEWPLVLLPFHVAFLHLIIDPACSIVLEAEPGESNVMKRPPRRQEEPLFSRDTLRFSIFQGIGVLIPVLAVYAISVFWRIPTDEARSLTFLTLVVANVALIFTNRSWTRTIAGSLREWNPALWWVTGGSVILLALLVAVPPIRNAFRFAALDSKQLVLCCLLGIGSVLWFELLKMFRAHRSPRSG
jgi:P-type Ca2+ transporter type 2C